MSEGFGIRYLPIFEQDLAYARDYIKNTLQNPGAARRLIDDTERAILRRLENPLAFEPYRSAKDREHPYYRIYVRNFTVWYVVIGDVMEVRRFLYGKRDFRELV